MSISSSIPPSIASVFGFTALVAYAGPVRHSRRIVKRLLELKKQGKL